MDKEIKRWIHLSESLNEDKHVSKLMAWKDHSEATKGLIIAAERDGFKIDKIKFDYFERSSSPFTAEVFFEVSSDEELDSLEAWLEVVSGQSSPYELLWKSPRTPTERVRTKELVVEFIG